MLLRRDARQVCGADVKSGRARRAELVSELTAADFTHEARTNGCEYPYGGVRTGPPRSV